MTSPAQAPDDLPILLLDFDGTICVGDEPVWAYADAVVSVLRADGATDVDAIGEQLTGALSDYLDGKPNQPTFLDGYTAVATLSADVANSDQLDRAYTLSRAALAQGVITVSAPPGLAELLRDLQGSIWRMLVTNAPADGVLSSLSSIGLGGLIDAVVTDAGKPSGWSRILPELLHRRPASSVMAVGDIWHNDIAAPLRAGASTALIDRFAHRAGPAHVTGSDFTELYPAVREWASDPASFASSHPVDQFALQHQQSAQLSPLNASPIPTHQE